MSVTCLECGEEKNTITHFHLLKCCGLTLQQYKAKYPRASIRSVETNRKISKSMRGHSGIGKPRGLGASPTSWKKGHIPHNKGISCPDVTKTKIRKTVTKTMNERYDHRKGKTYEEIHGVEKAKKIKEKLSISVCNGYEKGKYRQMSKFGYFKSTLNNKKLHYRSSYELKAFEILDASQNTVLRYSNEKLRIPYIKAGVIKNYIPDILIEYRSGEKQIVEIKPLAKLNWEDTRIKAEAATEYCKKNNMTYSIWTEKELGIK